jgi:hypothetical protein
MVAAEWLCRVRKGSAFPKAGNERGSASKRGDEGMASWITTPARKVSSSVEPALRGCDPKRELGTASWVHNPATERRSHSAR